MTQNCCVSHDCFFCGEAKFSLNKAIGLPCEDSVIYQDDNLFITPDIAPLVKGHFLIVTHEHLLSFAEASDSVIESLEKAKIFLSETIFGGGDVLFFEHGSVGGLSTCDCIDHAHIHALPISLDVDNYIKNSSYVKGQRQIASRAVMSEFVKVVQPYLYYEQGENKWLYPVDTIPSQFFRELVAFEIKTKYNYNWKISFREDDSRQRFMETLDMGLQVIARS